ncbi:chorismate synthase [Patescibacteria group bacterium]|nr:chorismate synthase [Patescibacteria group bacterium]
MPGSSFGNLFRITTFGESHGKAIGVIIDGCPPNYNIDSKKLQEEMDRRRPGASKVTTQRKEEDKIEILSGIFENKTLGTPISILIHNRDNRPDDYDEIKNKFRPSHADYTYFKKYGFFDYRGGGRSSARETASRVAAGAIAKQILKTKDIEIIGYTKQIYDIFARIKDPSKITLKDVEKNIVRCPDPDAAKDMEELILNTKEEGDSLGGIVECVIKNVPTGLGEPVFDKLEAELAKSMLSIPAVKGFEIGSGFSAVYKKGSEHNDIFIKDNEQIKTTSNNSGGVQGGISNGMDIIFRVAFKPTATINKEQKTVNTKGEETSIHPKGRHDPCVVPRAVPIVEAMSALVIIDNILMQETKKIS